MAVRVSTGDVVAFRLHAHHLTQRLAEGALAEAAGACAVQDSPPGSASLALHARVQGVTEQGLVHAVADTKSLLRTWCMRGAPFLFPVADTPVFTTGVLPPSGAALGHLVPGVSPALARLGMGLPEAVERCRNEIRDVLAGRSLTINDLGAELAARIAPGLPPAQRRVWEEAGPYAPGQPIGEAVVHFCLRILTLQGVVCFGARIGSTSPFVLVEEWLGHPLPDADVDAARAELLRRYLHCYGPSTRRDFAAWLGVRRSDVDPWWLLVEDELTPVDFGGGASLLTADLELLRKAPAARGVRLLPPGDPYTQMRDHETILDKQYHRAVWRAVGAPGAVLVDGSIAATWRHRTVAGHLTITVESFGTVAVRDRRTVTDEAEQVARLRGASSVQLAIIER